MGRATKWFRGLFGLKKPDSGLSASKPSKEKRRWSFVKSYREKDNHVSGPISNSATVPDEYDEGEESQQTTFSDGVVDPNKRAIAVAAATAAVAEAAVVAAQAAAAVVRLTSSGRCASNPVEYVNGNCIGVREERAAIRIQAAFRGCLARRALRALKGLVRLQALVRGHIERKRTVEWLRRMQALLQAQKIARSMRAYVSDSSNSNGKSSQFHQPGPATPEKFEPGIRSKSMKLDQSSVLRKSGSKAFCRNISYQDNAHSSGLSQSDGWLDERSVDQLCSSSKHTTPVDEKSDRIVEIDTGKPRRRRNLFRNSNHGPSTSDQSFTTSKDSTNNHQTDPSPPSCEVQSPSPLKLVGHEVEESSFWTTHNSPQFYSASLRCCDGPKRSPFTPTKSDGSRSFLNGYSDYPNYMAYTESSKAKVRSLSAPKQRPQYERSSSAKRCYVGSSAQKMHTLHANFTNKAYPGSGRLDNMGMPIGYTY